MVSDPFMISKLYQSLILVMLNDISHRFSILMDTFENLTARQHTGDALATQGSQPIQPR